MKIFFIYPSSGSQLGFNYGVAHMAAILKNAGHHVEYWQLCEDLEPLPTEEQFAARIKQKSPDVLAFSVVTNQWPYTQRLASWARKVFSGPIVIGGIHTLAGADEILRTGLFDYVFRGECEDAFLEFIEKLRQDAPLDNVANLAYCRNGQIIINPVRSLPDLPTLPPKDYESMDFQRLIDAKNGWVGLMTSRGCPFSCTYCFNHVMVSTYKHELKCSFKELNYMRRFGVEQVIDEIKHLQDHYRNITMFIFDDDIFTFDESYVEQFCRAYKRVTDIPFVVNAHVGFFDERRARALAEANCRIVKFGIESGSPEIRGRILNRHMTNESIIQAIKTVRDFKMHSSIFLIIGFPHETADDVYETIKLTARALPGRFRWTFFFPFPGTKAYQISQQGRFIDSEKMQRLKNFTDESCLDFGPEQNLLLKKIGRIMPWFVNAQSDLPVAEFYREQIQKLLDMDETRWQEVSPTLYDKDKEYSRQFSQRGLSHYAIKFNRFMGVISDYFLNEKQWPAPASVGHTRSVNTGQAS